MRRAIVALFAVVIAAGAGIYIARKVSAPAAPAPYDGRITKRADRQPDTEVTVPHPVADNNEIALQPHEEKITGGGDPVAKTVQKLLNEEDDSKNPRAIPKGTRLISLEVKDGVAVVNFSSDFSHLNDHGSTAEEVAQNSLRAVLAQFPQIKKMRVLVDGKVFEGEHAGAWDDIPVRDASASASHRGANIIRWDTDAARWDTDAARWDAEVPPYGELRTGGLLAV